MSTIRAIALMPQHTPGSSPSRHDHPRPRRRTWRRRPTQEPRAS